jgi:hypothetical protein
LGRFEGRSSIRTWLYTIATRTSLDLADVRGRRALLMDLGPASERVVIEGNDPATDVAWLGPYPGKRVRRPRRPVRLRAHLTIMDSHDEKEKALENTKVPVGNSHSPAEAGGSNSQHIIREDGTKFDGSGIPNSIAKQLSKDPRFRWGVQQGLKILGE